MLLSGISGTGKTTLIRIIAKSILCQHKDENGSSCNKCEMCQIIDKEKLSNVYFELNASNLGIDDMRDIEESADKRVLGMYDIKIFVIDEMQEMSRNKAAEKNILKILEKPSNNVYFILGTMEANKVNSAIKNRCVHYKLSNLTSDEIVKCMHSICKNEDVKINTPEKVQTLITIANNSSGSMRTAISYLERAIYSELWNTSDLLKELDIISDQDIAIIVNFILAGNVKALDYTINEEVLKKIKYVLMLCYKKLNGVELNGYQNGRIREINNLDKNGVLKVINKLNELSVYPYTYPDLIEFYILQAINEVKEFYDKLLQEEKPRRVRKE
jgi:DNA polymerase-3 subunit gamma/tau